MRATTGSRLPDPDAPPRVGAMGIGAVPIPGPNLLTSRDCAFRIHRGEAVAAVTDGVEPRRSTRSRTSC
jgi:hypothetical protein